MSDKPEDKENHNSNDCAALAPSQSPHRWLMLAGVWLIYACFGLVLASMAPLVQVITEDLQLSLSAMGSILGAWPLVYIGAAIPAGTLLDRFGLRRSLLVATLLMALSGALRAGAGDGLSLFFAVAVFGVGGVLGPLTLGIVADVTGGFDLSLSLLSGLCVLLAAIAWRLRENSR